MKRCRIPLLRTRLKKLLGPALLLFCLNAGQAQGSGFGLGIIIGEPTGLSMKAWLGEGSAFDLAAAWSFEGRGFLHLHGDYLRHADVIDVPKGFLPFYYGIGARLRIREDDRPRDADEDILFGIRIPLGMTYLFVNAPLDLFVEIAPVVELVPSTDVDLDGGIGIRFYF
jgi:hypothetical protein